MRIATITVALLLPAHACFAQVSVWTHRYDNGRSGANLAETVLTTGNVNVNTFGKLFSQPVDGSIFAQPLYLPNVAIPSKGVHNVLYVATMNDSVYAFDADSNGGANAAPLWSVSYINPASGITPVPSSDVQPYATDISGPIGILSTPVIDRTTGTLYLVARTKENTAYVQRLHALDITTGTEKFGGPVAIQASVSGSAPDGTGGVVTFNPRIHNQRASLALANGNIYIAWASHNDAGSYHGWVMAYNAATLQQTGAFNVTPDNAEGGVWQAGAAPAVDVAGNVYYVSGNGSFDGIRNFSESVMRFGNTGLTLADWFAPDSFNILNSLDYDLGSSGPLLIPDTNLILSGGKQGIFYLLNTGNLGHTVPGNPQIVQSFLAAAGHIHGSPIYWASPVRGPLIYVWSEYDYLQAFHFNGSTLDTTSIMQSPSPVPNGMPGGFLSISSNGNTAGTGILWASTPLAGDASQMTVAGIARAFDASDLSHELWNSQQNATRDSIGNFAKFVPPVVANGKLYVATFSNTVAVYGLLPASNDFLIAAAPNTQTVVAGLSTNFGLSISAVPGFTYNSSLSWSVSALPAGASPTFTPASSTGQGTASLAVTTTAATPAGNYALTITGTGAVTHSVNVTLSVTTTIQSMGPPADQDIGAPGQAGGESNSAGSYTVSGSGADIWASIDQFHFTYWPMTGDGTIIARVTSIANTSFYAKAGVMMRETLDPASRYAFSTALPSLSVFQYRIAPGSSAAGSGYYAASYPVWVRLVRANGNFTSYSSTDGATWKRMGSPVSIGMAASMYIGLAVTSQTNTSVNTAMFDNLSITGPDSTSGVPDFTIATGAVLAITPGTGSSLTAAVAAQNGFTGTANLSITGLPAGITAAFSPTSITGGGNATLTISASSLTSTGIYTPNLTGTSGPLVRITPIALNVGAGPDFTLAATPASQAIMSGNNAVFMVSANSTNGFAQIVQLSISGLPAGVSATFEPAAVDRLVSSALTLSTATAAPPGTYSLTITGTSASRTHSTTATLVVSAPPDFSLGINPASQTVAAGFGAAYTVSTAPLNLANGSVSLSITGLPSGAAASFRPAMVVIGGSSILSVNTNSLTAPGSYTLTITATSATLTHTIPATLIVGAPTSGSNQDIGAPGLAGNGTSSAGSYTVSGSGTDIWGSSDQFHFTNWPMTGDGTITARVTSITNTSFYAKAGVMMRETLDPTSRYAFSTAVPGSSVFQYRTAPGSAAAGSGYYAATYPVWVRLVRANGNFTSYSSTDGTSWKQMGSAVSIGMTASMYVGLAVSSQTNTSLNTAVFDNVSFTGPDSTSGLPDFIIGSSTTALAITSGAGGGLTASITAQNGFAGIVNLSVTGLPAGATGAFNPTSITGGGNSTLTISIPSPSPIGTYSLNLIGTSGSLKRSIPLILSVATPAADGDIGSTGKAGSASASGATYTVIGSGADIWGTSDQFHYYYWPLNGDGTVTVRIVSVTNTNFYAKAGIMIRETLDASSAYAFAAGVPTLTVFQTRTAAGQSAISSAYYPASYPVWVRLVRASGSFTAYASANGTTWNQMGSPVAIGMAASVYVGLAVTAHDNIQLNTAVFDNLTRPGSGGP